MLDHPLLVIRMHPDGVMQLSGPVESEPLADAPPVIPITKTFPEQMQQQQRRQQVGNQYVEKTQQVGC